MMYGVTTCLVLLISAAAAYDGTFISRNSLNEDKGYVKNCGDAKHNFTAWWQPKKLVIGKEYTAAVDFTPASDWSSGTLTAAVWLAKDPEQPIYKTSLPVNCDYLKKIPGLCPFKAGKRIAMQKSHIQFKLPYPLPAEKYKLQGRIDDDKGQLFVCAEAEVELADASDSFDFDMFKDGYL